MEKYLFFLLFFVCAPLYSQTENNPALNNNVKLNLTAPWLGVQSIVISYERQLADFKTIEVEGTYSFDNLLSDRNLPLTHTFVDLDKSKFSGAVFVFSKDQFKEDNWFYLAYGGGFRRLSYENTHTVCTEVDDAVENICPCLAFETNTYTRSANMLNAEIRAGIQNPVLSYKRFRFELYFGLGLRYLFFNDQNRIQSEICDDLLEESSRQSLVDRTYDFMTWNSAASTDFSLFPYISSGIKIGYAF